MIFWQRFVIPSLIGLILTGCTLSSEEVARKFRHSLVLINYDKKDDEKDKPGYGTGFFVKGAKGVCTLLTTASW